MPSKAAFRKHTPIRKLTSFGVCLLLGLTLTAAQNQTISVNNTVNIPLGNVTLENQSEQKTLYIPGSGIYSTDMNAAPDKITIQGQTLLRPDQGPVIIASTDTVLVKWYSSYVQVIDPDDEL